MTAHLLGTILTATIVAILPKVTFYSVLLKIFVLAHKIFNNSSQQCKKQKSVTLLSSQDNT